MPLIERKLINPSKILLIRPYKNDRAQTEVVMLNGKHHILKKTSYTEAVTKLRAE